MSQPPPIAIQFAVKGLDDVKKALKSITDAAGGTTQKSKAAAKATADTQTKEVEKGVQKAVKAVVEGEKTKTTARKAGLKSAEAMAEAEVKAAVKAVNKYTNVLKESRRKANIANEAAHGNYFNKIRNQRVVQSFKDEQAKQKEHNKAVAKEHNDHLSAREKREKEWGGGQNLLMESRRKAMVQAHSQEQRDIQRALTPVKAAKPPPLPTKGGVFDEARKALGKPGHNLGAVAAGLDHPLARLAKDIDGADSPANIAKRTRLREKAERYVARLKDNYFAEEQRREEALAAAKQKAAEKLAHTTLKGISSGLGTAGGVVKGIVGGAINAAGGFSVQDSVQNEVRMQGQAAGIAASSEGNFKAEDIMSKARATGIQYGIDPSEVLRSIDQVKKMTGNTQMGLDMAPMLAEMANAMGGDVGELGSLAGNILASNPKMNKEQLKQQTSMFAHQGMVGGVEIEDFAKFGGNITAGAQYFGGDSMHNQETLGAFAQIARQKGGASSAAEATMAAKRFGSDISKHSKDIKDGLGIDVSDGHGGLRDPEEIMMDMVEKTGGDVTKLSSTKLGERGIKPLLGMSAIYKEAGGGEAGKKAMRDEVKKYRGSMSGDEIAERNKVRMQAADKQLESAMLQLNAVVGQQLVPELVKFMNEVLIPAIPQIKQLFAGLAALADFLINHPFTGVGLVVAGSIAKEFAGAFAKSAFEKILTDNAALITKFGGAASVAAGALAAIVLVKELLDDDVKKKGQKDSGRVGMLNEVTNLVGGGGKVQTPEGRAQAAALAEKLKAEQTSMNKEYAEGGSFIERMSKQAGRTFNPEETKQLQAMEAENNKKANEQLTEALKLLTAAMLTAGPPSPKNTTGNGNSGPVGAPTRTRPK